MLPKADMHVHLEGTMAPDITKRIADRNGLQLKPGLLAASGAHFQWEDDGTAQGALMSFCNAYDDVAGVLRTVDDYADITYDYLHRVAGEGCIYAEISISADHALQVGLTYPQLLEGVTRGYEKAKQESGIEARFLSTFVRHYGVEKALNAAKLTHDNPHPLVTGLNIAGDENALTFDDFIPAYEAAGALHRTAHAGEAAGPESVRAARKAYSCKRFGHMVRAIEDENLMKELIALGAAPEVCVSSNMVLKVFPDYKSHPLRRFFDAGLKVSLGSDAPAFFSTSIGQEYDIARDHFGFHDDELLQLTKNAIETAFVDEDTRADLQRRLG